ncbi:PASTA domain-containing protein [Streptomyces sp. GMR22]|uniref:PASTA domain-containing protein n=1 Tax=Streptomyces sp. GMR22 TaxID=2759524 RepID=UPI0015FAA734|nr:PASTA domain-containing protein [Streptomyces sp. GMR22]MBA6441551.1 PASTA domain-containing protein [Streptomyces sp. GMR22]
MTPYGDPRPSGRTRFEEELMNAMNQYADSADAPEFDAPQIVRRTRRRRTVGLAAGATALILAGGGTALATSAMSGSSHPAAGSHPAASGTAAKSDATVMLYGDDPAIPIDFAGWTLEGAKSYLKKTRTKLGTVSKGTAPGCKPGSVIGVSPHAPKVVHNGDTVSFTLCAGG